LLADENVPGPSVAHLRSEGIDVTWIAELAPGVTDQEVLRRARDAGRIVVTFDRDLAELVVRHQIPPPRGVVLLRFVPRDPVAPGQLLRSLLARTDLTLDGRVTVVRHDRIRQRRIDDAQA
jgi:predicted nuclease of predicted toxin-antitoxin system